MSHMTTQTPGCILMLSPLEPHSSGNGSQRRAAAHLSALVRTSRVHLVVLDSRNAPGVPGDKRLLDRCASVSIVKYRWQPRPMWTKMAPFPTLAEVAHPTVERWLPSDDQIKTAFAHVCGEQLDAVLCFKLISATILDRAQRLMNLSIARRVVDFDDIQSVADERAAQFEKYGIEQSVIEALIRRQVRRAEAHCLATYDAVWVCSSTDRDRLLARRPRADIHVIPNSVDMPPPTAKPESGAEVRLLFVGTLSYAPNHDGILWFCRDVLPRIRANSLRRVHLTIVGFNPSAEIVALEEAPDVTVAGSVESVAPYYTDSDIVIAPIRFGSGTRIKILEAMSYRRPVVSTTLGAEGIDATPGKHLMIGDTADEFAAACLDLIVGAEKRSALGAGGYSLIEEKYSDKVVRDMVTAIL